MRKISDVGSGLSILSKLAVERALRWYVDRGAFGEAPQQLAAAEAEALLAVVEGSRAWNNGLFNALFAFGQTMHGLAEQAEAPRCNVGDVLTTLATLRREPAAAWPFDAEVDHELLTKLDVKKSSSALASTQRANREGWWAHARKSRAFIEEAAATTAGNALAVVLGAGHAYDLPLNELAKRFERVVLVDIDEEALAAVMSTFADPGLRARVEPRVMDLTGINRAMTRALDEIFAQDGPAEEILTQVDRLAQSYRLEDGFTLLPPGERADLLVSALVVTQVSWPQRMYAERLYEARFGRSDRFAERSWIDPWWQFEMRVQQDHINALAASADRVALTSDVVLRHTALDRAGVERDTGQPIAALGVRSLRERIPQGYKIDRHDAWQWSRNRPDRRGGAGSRRDVEAVALHEPRGSGGLWVPG